MTTTTSPRPASDFDALLLLDAVGEVARAARPVDPERVAQRPWDRARLLSVRFADAPPARRIAERLGLKWSEVVRIALLPPGTRERTLGRQLGESNQDWLTDQYIAYVLRHVAASLEVQTLTPAQYRAERTRLLAADASRWRHGGQLRLPNEHQLATAAGGWPRALRLAGLSGVQRHGASRAHVKPGSIVELIERCFAHHGTEPTSGDIVVFARANGIPYPRMERPWSEAIREWKDGRRAQGLDVADRYPKKADRPDYTQDVGAALSGERRHDPRDDSDTLADSVATYLRQLPRGDRASKRGYDAWASNTDGAPWASRFDQHGGWSAVLTAARERMRST